MVQFNDSNNIPKLNGFQEMKFEKRKLQQIRYNIPKLLYRYSLVRPFKKNSDARLLNNSTPEIFFQSKNEY